MKNEVTGQSMMGVLLPSMALLTGALVIGDAEQHPSQNAMTQQHPAQDTMTWETTVNPLPKDVTKKFHDQSVRVKAVEDEARALFQKKQYAAAAAACHRAIAMSPEINGRSSNMAAWQLLGQIYMEQGRYREALPFFSEATHNTHNDELNLDMALCYFRLGDLKEARQLYSDRMISRYMSNEPDSQRYLPGTNTAKTLEASILFARGYYAYMRSRTEKAERNFSAAARLAPTNAKIAYLQAMALRELKRSPEALRCFTRAVAYGTSDIVRESTYQLSLWPNAEREKALKEAAKLKAAKS